MTLTLDHGPLSGKPPATNYSIDGPMHKLLMHPFGRRIRARLGDVTVLDSRRATLVHETGILPQLYVPLDDLDRDLLVATKHRSYCPFKGAASYWSVRAGEREARNAIWTYGAPKKAANWLLGLTGVYWDSMDAWFDEDEEIHGHVRDPYHRVDAVRSSSRVEVRLKGELVAESSRPLIVSETGHPNRYYLPADDVRTELLRRSETRTVCPYKGEAEYWSIALPGALAEDAVFSYPRPLPDQTRIAELLCLLDSDLVTTVDGEEIEG
ncbi:DUF427 domain-containing protein [Thermoleophilia bacterium SCSIO 60948]|nr:DUF427 domain-containing protein [Thermoleophilia bacterium SCSIO 60948]